MGTFSKFIAKFAGLFANAGWVRTTYFFENPETAIRGSSKKNARRQLCRYKPQKSVFSRRGVRNH